MAWNGLQALAFLSVPKKVRSVFYLSSSLHPLKFRTPCLHQVIFVFIRTDGTSINSAPIFFIPQKSISDGISNILGNIFRLLIPFCFVFIMLQCILSVAIIRLLSPCTYETGGNRRANKLHNEDLQIW
jgi:hypothetical protein